ncbi:hypothetical protein HOY80DRAFT_1136812 [Tuber brumale]|nr:hypothetical protein HOY80DRAFT_1136812 [Tuber brumale]
MKFTSSILLLVLPALSIARPSPQTAVQETSPTPCVDGERRCDAGNTWSLCISGRFVPQGVNGPDSECTQLQVRKDDGDTTLLNTLLGLKYVGNVDTTPGSSGSVGIASVDEGPREYPLLAGPSMNITLVVTGGADGDKNGTATRLRRRQSGLRCTRVCMNGSCHVGDCQFVSG